MTASNNYAQQAALAIKQRLPGFKPVLGLVLGSGLGNFADHLANKTIIPYAELPGFPHNTVQGHRGNLVAGSLHGVDIVCLQGRAHRYEADNYEVVKTYVRTLKLLGCDYFFATNASGSLREDAGPGELMLITDHINLQPGNPLVGLNDEEFGPRFFPLDNAYDQSTRNALLAVAEQQKVTLHQGVYIAVLGPNYETAAEIRAFRILGADAVGMSTVPEVLVANHCGMKVAVIATITNYATGLATTSHDHNAVLATAAQAEEKLSRIINGFIKTLT